MAIANTGIQERGARGLIELKLNGEESNHKHITASQRGRGRGGRSAPAPPPPRARHLVPALLSIINQGVLTIQLVS